MDLFKNRLFRACRTAREKYLDERIDIQRGRFMGIFGVIEDCELEDEYYKYLESTGEAS